MTMGFQVVTALSGGTLDDYYDSDHYHLELTASQTYTRLPTTFSVRPAPLPIGAIDGFLPLMDNFIAGMRHGKVPYGPGTTIAGVDTVFASVAGWTTKTTG